MNYLQLVKELHRGSGSGGVAPIVLTDLRGENLRLLNWIKQADLYIQNLYVDWQFLWSQEELTLAQGVSLYEPVNNIGEFDRDAFFLDGEPLAAVNYLEVRVDKRETDQGLPFQAVIMPDGLLRFDQTPDQTYTVMFDYWREPIGLVDNDTDSLIPARFHYAIIGKALLYYSEYEESPEIEKHGARLYTEWLNKLESNQLPGDRYMHNKAEGNEMVIEVG